MPANRGSGRERFPFVCDVFSSAWTPVPDSGGGRLGGGPLGRQRRVERSGTGVRSRYRRLRLRRGAPWGTLPEGWSLGLVSHVAVDSKDRVYFCQRKDPLFWSSTPAATFSPGGVASDCAMRTGLHRSGRPCVPLQPGRARGPEAHARAGRCWRWVSAGAPPSRRRSITLPMSRSRPPVRSTSRTGTATRPCTGSRPTADIWAHGAPRARARWHGKPGSFRSSAWSPR